MKIVSKPQSTWISIKKRNYAGKSVFFFIWLIWYWEFHFITVQDNVISIESVVRTYVKVLTY